MVMKSGRSDRRKQIAEWNRQIEADAAANGRTVLEEIESQQRVECGLPLEEMERQIHLTLRLGDLGRLDVARAFAEWSERGEKGSYDRLLEHVGEQYDMQPEEAHEYLRVGRALARLPLMSEALADGVVHWETMRLLTRVATSDDEAEWLTWCDGRTFEAVEARVSSCHACHGVPARG